MADFMNTKQIADLCEKDVTTIRRWIKQVFPLKIEDGKETQLSLDEVRQLFEKAFGLKIASMLMQNAQVPMQNAEDKIDRLTEAVGALCLSMKTFVDAQKPRQLQIEDKRAADEIYYSARANREGIKDLKETVLAMVRADDDDLLAMRDAIRDNKTTWDWINN